MKKPAADLPSLPRLMLVTDRHFTNGRDLVDVIAEACTAGLRFIQVRERDLPGRIVRDLVRDLLDVVAPGTHIVVNGRAEVAEETGCGLHLPAAAPYADPLPALWGRAVHDEKEARRAVSGGARYLVVGTIFPTPSKPQDPGTGVGLIERIVAVARDVPVFAIGGVDAGRVAEVRSAGAYGVAVRRAILSAREPAAATRELLERLHG